MIDPPDQAHVDVLPDPILALLQRAMAQYRADPAGADFLFAIARSQAPDSLPLYRALIKCYNRERRFDTALDVAVHGLSVAARLASLPPDWREWTPNCWQARMPALPC